MRTWPLLSIPVFTIVLTAQTTKYGTVTGHVYCADTNAPARMARVELESVTQVDDRQANRPYHYSGPPPGGIVETSLDGSFTLSSVPAGSYYVIVSAAGYLAPRANDAEFDNAEPQPPTGQPPIVIPKVEVQADQTASVDVRLERGAAVSGTIRFDDGSPASGVHVILLHKQKEKWVASRFNSVIVVGNMGLTDDLGHYRLSGLRDREYLLKVMLDRVDMLAASAGSKNLEGANRSSVMIYSGDTPHMRDAVPFKLSAGEERAGEDITIPLSKFHTVAGVVTAARDGHTLNDAFVQISDPDSKDPITSTEIGNDGTFRLEGVPEGTYVLLVTNAGDKQIHESSIGEHQVALSESKTIHPYGELKQTIKVENDISNLVLSVPDKSASQGGKQTSE